MAAGSEACELGRDALPDRGRVVLAGFRQPRRDHSYGTQRRPAGYRRKSRKRKSARPAERHRRDPAACSLYWPSPAAATRTGPAGPTSDHEAHLAAKEAQAREDPWFSRADAHARRPRRDQAAPAQGPQAPHPLTCPRDRATGASVAGSLAERRLRPRLPRRTLALEPLPRPLRVPAREDEPDEDAKLRLGVSVSRKVGGAAERNAVKRAIREAFWAFGERLPEAYDFVLVARRDIAPPGRARRHRRRARPRSASCLTRLGSG